MSLGTGLVLHWFRPSFESGSRNDEEQLVPASHPCQLFFSFFFFSLSLWVQGLERRPPASFRCEFYLFLFPRTPWEMLVSCSTRPNKQHVLLIGSQRDRLVVRYVAYLSDPLMSGFLRSTWAHLSIRSAQRIPVAGSRLKQKRC